MAKLVITGVPGLDGSYDLDVNSFTNRELHTIKELSGVRGGELRDAVQAGDNDLVVAFAVIVIRRAGIPVDPDQLWDADLGCIQLDLRDKAEDDDRPPASSPTPNGNENSGGAGTKPNEYTASSGMPSTVTGAPVLNGQSLTGLPGSATPATSVPETSAI